MDKIVVQKEDFDLTTEVTHTRSNNSQIGAIVSFIGTVRDLHPGSISSMTLEHYPEMTEKSLKSIVTEARERWDLQKVTIIHRIGELKVNDQIVLVVTTSKHRQAAFESCNFIMDYLKTDAPFWKKESTEKKEEWVESRESDDEQKKRWQS
jgi:molybdopterin synthase catalytic subunit